MQLRICPAAAPAAAAATEAAHIRQQSSVVLSAASEHTLVQRERCCKQLPGWLRLHRHGLMSFSLLLKLVKAMSC